MESSLPAVWWLVVKVWSQLQMCVCRLALSEARKLCGGSRKGGWRGVKEGLCEYPCMIWTRICRCSVSMSVLLLSTK